MWEASIALVFHIFIFSFPPGLVNRTVGVQHIQQCIADARGDVAASLASGGHNIGHVAGKNQLLGLHHIDKAHWYTDDQLGMNLALIYQLVQADKGSGGVSDGINSRLSFSRRG